MARILIIDDEKVIKVDFKNCEVKYFSPEEYLFQQGIDFQKK